MKTSDDLYYYLVGNPEVEFWDKYILPTYIILTREKQLGKYTPEESFEKFKFAIWEAVMEDAKTFAWIGEHYKSVKQAKDDIIALAQELVGKFEEDYENKIHDFMQGYDPKVHEFVSLNMLKQIKSILIKLNAGQDYSGFFGEGVATNESGVHDTRMDVYKPRVDTIVLIVENDGEIYRSKLQPIWKELSQDKLNEQYSRRKAFNLLYPIAQWGANKWLAGMVEWADDDKSVVKKPDEKMIDDATDELVKSFEIDFEDQNYDYMKGKNPLEGLKAIKKVLKKLINMNEYADPYNLALKYLQTKYPKYSKDYYGVIDRYTPQKDRGIKGKNLQLQQLLQSNELDKSDRTIALLLDQYNADLGSTVKKELQLALKEKGINSVY